MTQCGILYSLLYYNPSDKISMARPLFIQSFSLKPIQQYAINIQALRTTIERYL